MSNSMGRYDGYSPLRSGALAAVLAAIAAFQSPSAVSQPSVATASDGAAPEVAALWQAHEFQFHYFGFRTYYSCAGLEDRLKQILRDLGAHPDVRVSAWGCMGLNDVNNMLSARIRVRMPTGSAASAADSFTATSEPVSLTTRRTGGVGSGDCELLEQVRDQLLPALSIPLVKDSLHCIPGQSSLIAQSLQVQALIADNGKE
jgi:hypothetical protein